MSELLREEQGKCEVGQKEDGEDEGDHGDEIDLHGDLPQLLAGIDVEERHGEEDYGEQQHECILHEYSFWATTRNGVGAS
jgi:hypothetical protein